MILEEVMPALELTKKYLYQPEQRDYYIFCDEEDQVLGYTC